MIRPATLGLGVALALASVSAHAQSTNVQLYGLLDAAVGSWQEPGKERDLKVNSGPLSTSYIGIRGEEAIGGGLAATFNL